MRIVLTAMTITTLTLHPAAAEPPTANYIFPAGGQRGSTVAARIGGCNLHRAPRLIWSGAGVSAPAALQPTETIWFEGPVIPQPASQQKEDYPRDFAAALTIAADAPLGRQSWRLATSQGITSGWGFIVGQLPEIIEQEFDGAVPPVRVTLPVTINGRIFPREDVDTWSFTATAGQEITCRAVTSAFGSPLDARIEVRDSAGRVLGEQSPEADVTPDLRFVAPADGEYQVRIHDAGFGGLQDHVYRLTLTSGPVLQAVYPLGGRRGTTTQFQLMGIHLPRTASDVLLPAERGDYELRLDESPSAFGEVPIDLDNVAEILEAEPNEAPGNAFSVPCVLNGRIQSAGDVDTWVFAARKGLEYEFEVRASRLGSALDAVIEVTDLLGNRLAEADDTQGLLTDAKLRWSAAADGEYCLVVRDRIASRGGDRFAYRVRVTSIEQPQFALSATTDALILERGKTVTLKIVADRGPGFKEPIVLTMNPLPAGVTVTSPAAPITIAANQKEVQLTWKAEPDARVDVVPIQIQGHATIGELELVQDLMLQPANPEPGRIAVSSGRGPLWLAVAVPTPFKFVGVFETKFIPRGSVFIRKYRIDRNGFQGPLEVALADRQGRHLQGVTAEPIVVPSSDSEFDFAVRLAPWMEIGRTCRSTLAVSGVVTDPDGTQHMVSFSSNDQNNQMIALVDPGQFSVQLPRATMIVRPGQRIELPIRIQRSPVLNGNVTVDLVAASPIQGVTAKPVEVRGETVQAIIAIEFADQVSGVGVHPVTIRATTRDQRGQLVVTEASLTLVPDR